MKEVKKAIIRLGEYQVDIGTVDSVSFYFDGRTVSIVDYWGKKYETAVQNVLIITEVIADENEN